MCFFQYTHSSLDIYAGTFILVKICLLLYCQYLKFLVAYIRYLVNICGVRQIKILWYPGDPCRNMRTTFNLFLNPAICSTLIHVLSILKSIFILTPTVTWILDFFPFGFLQLDIKCTLTLL